MNSLLEAALSCASIIADDLPPRDWVLGVRQIRRMLSVLVAPGGVGKSSLALLECASVASGRPLSGDTVHARGAAVLWCIEDDRAELERRVAALAIHHGLTSADLVNLYIISGHDWPARLVYVNEGQPVRDLDACGQIVDFLREVKASLFVVDPLVESHSCDENNNGAMAVVAQAFRAIAADANCAVCLVHHSRKGAGTAAHGDQDMGRGASSVVSAARIAATMSGMSDRDAIELGIDPAQAGWYVRLDDAKGSMRAPSAASVRWFKRVSVDLPNGDSVGTLEAADIAALERESEATADLKTALEGMAASGWLAEPRATSKVADAIAAGGGPAGEVLSRLKAKTSRIRLIERLLRGSVTAADGRRIVITADGPDARVRSWVMLA